MLMTHISECRRSCSSRPPRIAPSLPGLRALSHYLQRTAVQGHPDLLAEFDAEVPE